MHVPRRVVVEAILSSRNAHLVFALIKDETSRIEFIKVVGKWQSSDCGIEGLNPTG